MKKFFESGMGFMVVALLCMIAGVISDNGSVFIGIGAFWLIMAIIVRAKNKMKLPARENEDTP